MSFYAQYPASASGGNLSVGINGALAPTSSTEVGGVGLDGNLHPLSVSNAGVLNVNIDSSTTNPLPVTDAAAEASLASINTKTPVLGQAAMAASSPVVIASNQSTLPVNDSAGNTLLGDIDLQLNILASAVGVDGGFLLPSVIEIAGSDGSSLRALATDATGKLNVNISSSVIPTGAATAANQATEIASLASIDSKLTSPITVTGPLTNAQLRATPVPVDGSGSTQPVSGTVTVTQATGTNLHTVVDSSALPTGAATAANQASQLTQETAAAVSVASIDTKTPALGQAVMANSVPVALASNQSAISVTGPLTDTQLRASAVPVSAAQSGTWNITNVSGTVSLPTGASTAAKQPALGTAGSASVDVITVQGIASMTALKVDGSGATQPVSAVSLPLPTGAATEASLAKLTLAQASTTSGQSGALIQGAVTTAAPSYTTAQTSPLSLDTAGNLRVLATAALVTATTATLSNVNSSASSVSLLASNSSRKNATFFNDSTATLYLKLGTTASATSYTVQVPPTGYYELPGVAMYTGAIDGIWSAANGAVRITEY